MFVDICGLFKFSKNGKDWGILESAPIPLVSVDVNASVVHTVAQVEVTQVYINREQQAIEAIYYFPVNPEGAVTHFEAELNGRKIKGTVKPCEIAKADYDEAVEKQNTAFLGEETKPDIFKIRVGCLKPGASAKLVIGYVTEVKNEPGTNAIRFYIPTTIAPRYVSTSETDKKAEDISAMTFSTTSPAPLSIKVAVSLQGKIKSIMSPTHKVKVGMTGPISENQAWEKAVVELATETTDMDRDFVLNILPEDIHRARLYSETLADGSTAMMVHLIPSFKLQEQKIEAIFVLDQSGSMDGEKINLARDGLLVFLHSLPEDCYFNVVGFGTKHKFLFDGSVKYDDITLKQALEYTTYMHANMGGTEIYKPLNEIHQTPCKNGYMRQIFVLTDGQVENTDAVLRIVHKNSNNSRLFAIGIGEAASHFLVEGVAKAGRGTSAFVTTNEGISKKVLDQLKNALQPSLTGIKIDWEEGHILEYSDRNKALNSKAETLSEYNKPKNPAELAIHTDKVPFLKQSPRQIPPVFDECQLLVFGVFKNAIPNAVTIKAESLDGSLMVKIECGTESDVGSTGMVHKLAAIKIIRELEEELRQLEEQDSSVEVDGLKQKIIQRGCQHEITSMFTSFVAVDVKSVKRTKKLRMKGGQVPSQLTNSSTTFCHKKSGRSVKSFPHWGGLGSILNRISQRRYTSTSTKSKSARHRRKFLQEGSSVQFCDSRTLGGILSSMSLSAQFSSTSNDLDLVANEDSSNELVRLINLQSFDGSFNLEDKFCHVFEKDLGVMQLAAKKNGLQNMELATAIAVATFTTRFASECDVWGLVVEKAKKWLARKLSPDHTEKALKLATTLI